ncbi:hypothetical protein ACX9MO_15260 [Pseudooceanicola sp. 502str34]
MKMLICLTLLLSAAGCVKQQVSIPALCSGTMDERRDHARALIEDGGPRSAATGAALLGKMRRGCAEQQRPAQVAEAGAADVGSPTVSRL